MTIISGLGHHIHVPVPVMVYTGNQSPGQSIAFAGTAPTTDNDWDRPTTWAWDFGDGQTADTQDATIHYDNDGNYLVSLSATNFAGTGTTRTTVSIGTIAPVADFMSQLDLSVVTFYDLSTGTPTSWSWDFGDGTTSTDQEPIHLYTTLGTFDVTFTATNSGGSSTCVYPVDIVELTLAPVANFSTQPGLVVTFYDESTNYPDAWAWDLGDGSSSQERYLNYQYTSGGPFTVTLTVSNLAGSNSITKSVDAIYFSISDETPSIGEYITCTNTSSYSSYDWIQWVFDGELYTGESFTAPVTYSAEQSIIMRFSFEGQLNYATNRYINLSPPVARIWMDIDGQKVFFRDESYPIATSWLWEFGDGSSSSAQRPSHTYIGDLSTFQVTLTATNSGGSDSVTVPIEQSEEPVGPG